MTRILRAKIIADFKAKRKSIAAQKKEKPEHNGLSSPTQRGSSPTERGSSLFQRGSSPTQRCSSPAPRGAIIRPRSRNAQEVIDRLPRADGSDESEVKMNNKSEVKMNKLPYTDGFHITKEEKDMKALGQFRDDRQHSRSVILDAGVVVYRNTNSRSN